jgi:ribosomal protein L11 methyltransferase
MSRPPIANDDRTHSQAPYHILYIYYLQGRLAEIDIDLGADYIGNWEEGDTSFLFFSAPADNLLQQLLADDPQLKLLDQYQMSYEDWHGEAITPFQTDRLRIVPPWMMGGDIANHTDTLAEIILDPGVVFGTGLHPTTRDCLLALEYVFAVDHPKTVLDLGTGTGLLAIAAIQLGCNQGLAVDVNCLAAKTALRNVHLNQMLQQLIVIQGKAEDFIYHNAELLIANIHFDVMQHLVQAEAFLMKKWYILSGLLRSEAREVEQMLAQRSLKVLQQWTHDGIWHTYLIQKLP